MYFVPFALKKERSETVNCGPIRSVFFMSKKCDSSLLHRAQATSANRNRLSVSVDRNLYLANIGLPTSVGLAVGVRYVLTEHNAFSADRAFCHP